MLEGIQLSGFSLDMADGLGGDDVDDAEGLSGEVYGYGQSCGVADVLQSGSLCGGVGLCMGQPG
jgi:hypothetical protein